MKRIQFACLAQTIHFMLKEDTDRESATALVRQEVEHYKAALDRQHTKYRVEEEQIQPDGSIVLRIKKQYNSYPCGDYLD